MSKDSDFRVSGPDRPTRIATNLIYSRDPVLIMFRYLLVAVLVVSGLRWLSAGFVSLDPELITRKDFLQDHLMAKAVAHGLNPYLPTSDLAGRFMGQLPHRVFAHPCPHPPPVALLLVPLAFFDFNTAARVWFWLEIALIGISVVMLSYHVKDKQRRLETVVVLLGVFAWGPFSQELVLGQLGALLLLLVVLAWQSLRQNRDVLGGILLGLSLSIKLYTWPIVLYYLLRRRWRIGFAAFATVFLANLLSAIALGLGPIRYYFLNVNSHVTDSYRSSELNMALWTLGWRLASGTGSRVQKGMEAEPLFYAPHLAWIISVLIVTLVLVLGLILAFRAHHVDVSFGILTCVSILASPIVWSHYLMLAALPLAIAFRQSLVERISGKASLLLLLCGVALFIPYQGIRGILLAGSNPNGVVPFVSTLPVFLPILALFLLIAALWRLNKEEPRHMHLSTDPLSK